MEALGRLRVWPLPFASLLRKEFRAQLRQVRSWVFLLLVMAAAIALVTAWWPDQQYVRMIGTWYAERQMQMMALFLGMAAVFFLPAVAATSVVIEREQETWDQLQITLISPAAAVLGKFFNSMGFFLLLVAALAPVVATSMFTVGVDWNEFLMLLATVVLLAANLTMLGIAVSAHFQRTVTAVIAGYALSLLFLFKCGTIAAGALALPFFRVRGYWMATPASVLRGGAWLTYLYLIIWLVVLYYVARWRMKKHPRTNKLIGTAVIDDPKVLRERKLTWPFYLIDPLARKKPVEDGWNPVTIREIRWGTMNRGTFYARLFFFSAAAWFVFSFPALADWRTMNGFAQSWLGAQGIIISLLCPPLVANLLTREYELGNIDMLRMTLLTPRQVMSGKWVAGISMAAPLVFSGLLAAIPLMLIRAVTPGMLAQGFATVLLTGAVCVSVGMLASLMTRRSATAMVLAVGMSAAVFYWRPFVVEAFGQLLKDLYVYYVRVTPSQVGVTTSAFFSPLRYLDSPLAAFLDRARLGLWGINCLVHVALILLLARASTAIFARRRFRDV